jgi:hypothetical protein
MRLTFCLNVHGSLASFASSSMEASCTRAGPDGACPRRRTWRASNSAADGRQLARRCQQPARVLAGTRAD